MNIEPTSAICVSNTATPSAVRLLLPCSGQQVTVGEREFYWADRVRPVQEPRRFLTWIFDGATQTYTCLPRMPNHEGNQKACQLKLVGCLFHGHVLILFIVHPHVPDDGNLSCHVIDRGLEVVARVRAAKGLPEYAPKHARCQLDGAGGSLQCRNQTYV